MAQANALSCSLEELGEIKSDVLQKMRNHGMHRVQDLLDEGERGCSMIGIDQGDITTLSNLLEENGFDRIN